MSKNMNEPAFPVTNCQDHEFTGLTIRDYFAVHACNVSDDVGVRSAEKIVGRPMPDFASLPLGNSIFWADYRAIMRYIEADAMLAARVKP